MMCRRFPYRPYLMKFPRQAASKSADVIAERRLLRADGRPRVTPEVVLGVTLAAAALLRFWGLATGLPASPGVDEPEVMMRAVNIIKTGDFNPHFFDYPGLYIYLEAAVAALRFVVGATQGQWSALSQAQVSDFYLWGRALTAILGTGTVWLLYCAGTRWDKRTAALAAVLLAVMPVHVRESHFALTDVPMTFFVTACLLLTLRAHERATLRSFAIAGAAAGLAIATKYNGVLVIMLPLLACLMTPAARPSRVAAIACVMAGAFAAFIVTAPYTVLDLPTFLNQFARLASDYRLPRGFVAPIWQVYLKHMRMALHDPGAVIAAGGFALAAWRIAVGPDRLKWILVAPFPLVYFKFISGQNLVFARYLMPLIPFVALLAAAFVVWIASVARLRIASPLAPGVALAGLSLIAIVPPAVTAVGFDTNATKKWTTAQAYDWITAAVPPGTSVVLEGSVTVHLPSVYRTTQVKQLRMAFADGVIPTNVQYLIASSESYGPYLKHPDEHPTESAQYRRIFSQTDEVARFTPSDAHPGPELLILRKK
jgi:4-amino-4-deoxy-L-arabinose transferase-like glycosyltransferase